MKRTNTLFIFPESTDMHLENVWLNQYSVKVNLLVVVAETVTTHQLLMMFLKLF